MTREVRVSREAKVLLASALAIVLSAVICIIVQGLLPIGSGPAFALFPYHGELVAIGAIGGVFPLLLCAMMVSALTTFERVERRVAPFTGPMYWLAVLLLGLMITALFGLSHEVYGGLGLTKLWAFWLIFAGGVAGVDYWWLRGSDLTLGEGAAECYVLGTLGVFGSDVIRTLSGMAGAPGSAAIWGGGGFLDILFWFGIYMALAYVCLRGALRIISRLTEGPLSSYGVS